MASDCLVSTTKDYGIDMHPEEIKILRESLMQMLMSLRLNETQEEKQQLIRNMLLKVK